MIKKKIKKDQSRSNGITFLQPTLPPYRVDFFDRLADFYGDDFIVYYSVTNKGIDHNPNANFSWARPIGPIKAIMSALSWQRGALSIPLKRGDVLVLNGDPRYISSLLLMVKACFLNVKTVWWGQYRGSKSKDIRIFIRLLIMRFADAVVFYTDQEISDYRLRLKLKDNRVIAALNNSINADDIEPFRKAYNPSKRGRNILFIGRISEKAQLPLLLKALALTALDDISLNIIGTGKLENHLKALTRSLNISERVTWHGEIRSEESISEIANECSIFVYPGEVGLSLIHGMAYGLPCVVHSSRQMHMPEIAAFSADKSGLDFKMGEVDSLAEAVFLALSDHQRLSRWSDYNVRLIESSYNTREMVKRITDLLAVMRS